ncbi:ferredoxin [Rhodobacteraceae bacterium CCMM004]|nr:ferredoxin [Rhodobacteraceae bacterium CCMM004]
MRVLGGLHPGPEDGLPDRIATLLLIGPEPVGFWAHVRATPEFADGRPDPLDRWSRRTIGRAACALGGKAYFPFGGPPWHPFIGWAKRSGQAWESPVGLLVHAEAGLMVSYRGAIGLTAAVDLPAAAARPCDGCAGQPCRAACPVGALTPARYDVPACRTFVRGPEGGDCRDLGCAVRRACPLSQSWGRDPAQSAFHMAAFARG